VRREREPRQRGEARVGRAENLGHRFLELFSAGADCRATGGEGGDNPPPAGRYCAAPKEETKS
jgi:hypothetical protein